MTQIVCCFCKAKVHLPTGAVNRARSRGANLYCGRSCSGVGRRKNKTRDQKVEEKRLYDMEYRRKNKALLKAKKSAYFQQTYDPAAAAIERKKNMARHAEYCRRPEYKEWKREYDRQYRAKQDYGEFWESFIVLTDIEREVFSRMSWYEIHLENGQLNKRNQRRRDYERTFCK